MARCVRIEKEAQPSRESQNPPGPTPEELDAAAAKVAAMVEKGADIKAGLDAADKKIDAVLASVR